MEGNTEHSESSPVKLVIQKYSPIHSSNSANPYELQSGPKSIYLCSDLSVFS